MGGGWWTCVSGGLEGSALPCGGRDDLLGIAVWAPSPWLSRRHAERGRARCSGSCLRPPFSCHGPPHRAAPGIVLDAHKQEERLWGPGAGGRAGQTGTDVHPRGGRGLRSATPCPALVLHRAAVWTQGEEGREQYGLVEEGGRPLSTVRVWVMDGREPMMEAGPWPGRSRGREPVASPLAVRRGEGRRTTISPEAVGEIIPQDG